MWNKKEIEMIVIILMKWNDNVMKILCNNIWKWNILLIYETEKMKCEMAKKMKIWNININENNMK